MSTSFSSVPELFLHRVASTPDSEAFSVLEEERWQRLKWEEVGARVRAVSCGLHALGVSSSQPCAILCSTRLEWIIADLAILCAGGAVVPMYPSASMEDNLLILEDSGAVVLFVESEEMATQIKAHGEQLPALKQIVVMDGVSQPADGLRALSTLTEEGIAWDAEHPDAYDARIQTLQPDQVATLLYTSGTSGQPRGAVLTHDCWVFEAEAIDTLGFLSPADKHFLWLPLAHSFGHVLLVASIRIGIPTAVDGRAERIVENMQRVRPTFTAAVPQVFERMHAQIQADARQLGGVRYRAFRWALDVGAEVSALQQIGQSPRDMLSLRHFFADRILSSRIRDRFGGKLRFFICGSAPLSRDLASFFHMAGVLILEGYGLTESAAAATVNRPDRFRFGTVGLPLPGVELRLGAEDDEVLIRCRGVMKGYHRRPEQSRAAVDEDGWLHTGDIGSIDEDGFLRIVGRKKDLIKTSGGKIVAPQKLEGRLKALCLYLRQVVVLGNGRSSCVALLTLNTETFAPWAQEAGLDHLSAAELANHPHVRALIQAYVDQLNADLARHEVISAFSILPGVLSTEAGDLTPSMKVKRTAIEARYGDVVESLYATLAESASDPA